MKQKQCLCGLFYFFIAEFEQRYLWPCSCAFSPEFEQVCIVAVHIFMQNSLCFKVEFIFNFMILILAQYVCHSRESIVFDSRWRVIWVVHLRVPCDSSCDLCVWVAKQYLNNFYVLFSSFQLCIVWLNNLSARTFFDWTVSVTVIGWIAF